MKTFEIKGFVETSLCDWDGCLSSVIFLPGCNFRCPFCQNGDLVVRPGDLLTVGFDPVADFLMRNSNWIDGVVITGGEPTLRCDLDELAGEIKHRGFKVKLDTNGTRPAVIEALLKEDLVDYVAMDVKAPLDGRYEAAAGVEVDLGALRRSIDLVRSLKDRSEFRTTLVPGLVGEEEVELIAETIQGAASYVLQRFVPENSLDNLLRRALPYDESFVSHLLDRAGKHVGRCTYRGKLGVGLS
ncbi:MAG: anaerobic ribonucleoside-triphosphate reductase activating protein [Candidatus Eisenbacteria bacterium]